MCRCCCCRRRRRDDIFERIRKEAENTRTNVINVQKGNTVARDCCCCCCCCCCHKKKRH